MPVHDWKRVIAGVFHDFHNAWLTELRNVCNEGLLPADYYALAEQHAGKYIADLLTLHVSAPESGRRSLPSSNGGIALAESPPRVRHRLTLAATSRKRRTLAIRHASGNRLVALIEIVSPANKDRKEHVDEFAAKAAAALDFGVHLLVVDLFATGRHDPGGVNAAIQRLLDSKSSRHRPPVDEPLTVAAYLAGTTVEVFVEHLAFGLPLPEMPLFLDAERYVNVPLESTYGEAYRGVPAVMRKVLERRRR